jgi:hypothetical protein
MQAGGWCLTSHEGANERHELGDADDVDAKGSGAQLADLRGAALLLQIHARLVQLSADLSQTTTAV